MVHSYHSYQQSDFTVRRPHVEGISSRVYILKINNADGLNSLDEWVFTKSNPLARSEYRLRNVK